MKVYTIDPDSEEQGAVVSARTSRSPDTFDVIQAEVRAKGHEQFLKTNVLGFGHDSVAEVAQCPIVAIEDISDLAANVVATSDPQLVVQMSSTRYQLLSARECYDLEGDDGAGFGASSHGRAMRDHYTRVSDRAQAILEATDHPRKRTLQCDIARSFLPAGISTQLGIRGNARVMRDAVSHMLGSDLGEVHCAGVAVRQALGRELEVLFDRHIEAAGPSDVNNVMLPENDPGDAWFDDVSEISDAAIKELRAWRDSGWRRRMRLAAAPWGCWLNGKISSDYGAYRDLRRNRTVIQSDLLPSPRHKVVDRLWAFRDLYPDLCDQLDREQVMTEPDVDSDVDSQYLASMGSRMTWHFGAHVFNLAYMLRLRSGVMCHPAYALPMRHLMAEILDKEPRLAQAMGIVESPGSLLGVEFSDRVTT